MGEVTLAQILYSREDRVRRQKQLLDKYSCPIISFTMNIAGPVKNTPLIERGFTAGLQQLEAHIPEAAILHKITLRENTGCLALYVLSMDAAQIKKICVEVEEASALGRLFDLDVLTSDGQKLSRSDLRGCLVCGAPGRACAAGRVHPVSQLQSVTGQILSDFFLRADSEFIADAAVQSLIEEVKTTPKPGLVDRRNHGSHPDMCLELFLTSANALRGYFHTCFLIGQSSAGDPPEAAFAQLRHRGILAEEDMYRATGGINTHKGAIYSLGLLCGCLGRLWTPEKSPITQNALMHECSTLAAPAADADFLCAKGLTAGERMYLQSGIKGSRGEASAGFPSIQMIGIPAFQQAIAAGKSREEAGVYTLLHLITAVQDTNLLHRGGLTGANWAAETVRTILNADPFPSTKQIEQLDDAFIQRNLSPGGCADLLALIYFLCRLYDSGFIIE